MSKEQELPKGYILLWFIVVVIGVLLFILLGLKVGFGRWECADEKCMNEVWTRQRGTSDIITPNFKDYAYYLEKEEQTTPPKLMGVCNLEKYYVKYVDDIFIENCYAVKQQELWEVEKIHIKESLLNPIKGYSEAHDYLLLNNNWDCNQIRMMGRLYCLKDNVTCLQIDDNNICGVINLT